MSTKSPEELAATFEGLMKLNTINEAARSILVVCQTFNSTIDNAMPLILATAERMQTEQQKEVVALPKFKLSLCRIETLKKGDIFHLPKGASALVYDGYNRNIKKYEYHYFDDISKFGSKKKGTLIDANRTF